MVDVKAPTSTLDKVLRGLAIAVIAAGGFLFFGGQVTFVGNGLSSVPPQVANFAAGSTFFPAELPSTADGRPPASAVNAVDPAPTPAVTAGTPLPPPTGIQTAWASNGWAVTLDLPFVSSGGNVVFAKSGSSPYPAGTMLVSVGGRDAGEDPMGIADLAASYFAFADPDGPRLPVSVRNLAFDSRGDGEIRVDVSRVVDFGAFTLSQRPAGEGWTVTVAIARPGSGLRDGDIVLSEASSGTPVAKTTDLEAVLAAFRASGVEEAVLLVQRSGATQTIPVALSDIVSTGEAG